MRPYSNKLTELLRGLSSNLDADGISSYSDQREIKRILIVAITSNRGLCGAFNSNIIKECIAMIDTEYADKEVDVITIGKKGNDILGKKHSVIANHSEVFDDLTFQNVAGIANELMELYSDQKYDQILLVYNRFKNGVLK